MNEMTDKLNSIIQQNEQLISVLATLIRTLESKGIFTKQDLFEQAAFGKALEQNLALFGINRK
mgnify:FL=1